MKALKDFSIVGKGFLKGEELNEQDLTGADVSALVEAGYIELATKKAKEKE